MLRRHAANVSVGLTSVRMPDAHVCMTYRDMSAHTRARPRRTNIDDKAVILAFIINCLLTLRWLLLTRARLPTYLSMPIPMLYLNRYRLYDIIKTAVYTCCCMWPLCRKPTWRKGLGLMWDFNIETLITRLAWKTPISLERVYAEFVWSYTKLI